MNIFDLIIVQPIFNLLMLIYAVVPGHDFGIALVLFTILVRMAMWPLAKKQLRQTKVMRQIQPELKRIKQRAKGNKQVEAQLMMELYREKGVNPLGSVGLLIIQLPLLIALYAVVRLVIENKDNIPKYTYGAIEKLPHISNIIHDPHQFNENFLGVINLTKHAFENGAIYWPVLVLAAGAAVLQFIQSKQLAPKPEEGRRLRDILKEQASGKSVDQSEVTALMSNRMLFLFPIITFLFAISVAGALDLYLLTSTTVAVLQQAYILRQDVTEMEARADQKETKKLKNNKAKTAKTATIVSDTTKQPTKAKRKGGKS